ncbi:MAG: NADH-quinone oxidoreductase subunit D [Ardenticatenaceae bacterium]|nr:NADH-quinone oxidoreductase subunit D [Ardenticatenaceae bacterium]
MADPIIEIDEPEVPSVDPVEQATATLKEKFPELSDDSRPNYTGIMVPPEKLLEVAKTLKDELGFEYLSSVTGVDLIDDGKMEVVYHTYNLDAGGGAVVLKTQVDRDQPDVPSLTPMWPGADFQEREAFDLLGINFPGHPDLRRILMWDGFEGHPLRKDWREAFYEQDNKPFKSRWPEGHVFRAEERTAFGKNVKYPAGWLPEGLDNDTDEEIYSGMTVSRPKSKTDIRTDIVTVNIGPQHPSTHGVFRMVVTLDGETVIDLKPVMGYLHRNHEKIGERNTFLQNIPYTDRLDYISSMGNNQGYVMAIEKLLGVTPPERAEWIRILMVELTRICNHLWSIGFLINDLGAFQTPMLYLTIERELILDLFEATAGSRMMCNYMRFGGLAYDLPPAVRGQETMAFLTELVYERLPKILDELDIYLTGNEIIRERCVGIGIMTREEAIAYSACGPMLRGSGVNYDVRKQDPYSYYEHLDFDIPVRQGGDVFDRYMIRVEEMHQSLKICRQVLPYLKQTAGAPILEGDPQYNIRVPQGGDAYGRVENPKGELGYYVTAKPKGTNPERYHIRAPSFINLTPLGLMSKTDKVADLVVILGSIDIVLGETDR